MLNVLISAVLQTLSVLLVAGIVYLLFGRKISSFARYIGLIPTSVRASILALVIAAIAASIMVLKDWVLQQVTQFRPPCSVRCICCFS